MNESLKQALAALEELNKVSVGKNAISLPAEIDTAMDALRKTIADAEKQKPLTNALTDREKSIIRFSVYRFSWAAHARLNEAAQDKNNFHHDIGAVEAFAKDCKDADALLVKLNFFLGIKENT